MSHPNSKTVTFHRAGSYLSRAQGKEIEDHFADSKVSIDSYWDGQRIATGLTFKEEDLLLPKMIDADAGDRDFRKKVNEYYADLSIKVPFKGLNLEIGLELGNDREVSKDNMPLNLGDYLAFRVARNHPLLAPDKRTADSNPTFTFYIFDKDAVSNEKTKKTKQVDAALSVLFSMQTNPVQVRQVLLLMGVDPRETPGKNQEEVEANQYQLLRDLATTKPSTFLETTQIDELELRYWITAMVKSGVLIQAGTRLTVERDKKFLGKNIEEAIAFFKDEDNEDVLTLLKAQQQEAEKTKPKQVKLQTKRLNQV